jgi:hypothetical protein
MDVEVPTTPTAAAWVMRIRKDIELRTLLGRETAPLYSEPLEMSSSSSPALGRHAFECLLSPGVCETPRPVAVLSRALSRVATKCRTNTLRVRALSSGAHLERDRLFAPLSARRAVVGTTSVGSTAKGAVWQAWFAPFSHSQEGVRA